MRNYLGFLIFFLFAFPAFSKCLNCNVILISLDTVGAKHLGIYGADQPTTPNIDAFAKKSRLYQNAYTVAPWTLPSHAAMLTGTYPWALGIYSQDQKVPPSAALISQLLKMNNYATGAITGGLYLTPRFGFDAGFDTFKVMGLYNAYEKTFAKAVDEADQWVSANKKKPFFLFLHTYDVHAPYLPTVESVRAMGGDGKTNALTVERIIAMSRTRKYTVEDEKNARMLYRAGLHDVDRLLGKFLTSLEKQGLMRNTIVIITADHGDELGEHGYVGTHGFTLYDEVLRVPLIVSVPNVPAKKIKSLVSTVDIVPTILSLVDVKWPSPRSGLVLPEVDSEGAPARYVYAISTFSAEELIKSYDTKQPAPVQSNRYAAISAKEKYIIDTGLKSNSVYDLIKDPKEKSAKSVKCKDVFCQMQTDFIFRGGAVK